MGLTAYANELAAAAHVSRSKGSYIAATYFWFPMPSRRNRKPRSQLPCEDQNTLLLVPTPTRLVQIPQRLCHMYQPTFPNGHYPTSRPPLLRPSLRYCKVGWQLRL